MRTRRRAHAALWALCAAAVLTPIGSRAEETKKPEAVQPEAKKDASQSAPKTGDAATAGKGENVGEARRGGYSASGQAAAIPSGAGTSTGGPARDGAAAASPQAAADGETEVVDGDELVVDADEAVAEGAAAKPDEKSKKRKLKVEDVYITGSRIRRTDLVTAAPVTVIGRQQIEASGLVSTGDILQKLPEQSNATNTQVNNGGDGSTRVNLRGLGSDRTLVLVNGRRFVAGGAGANASVDLNTIPSEIIERVEVLKDGASAIYGSDAISGVVNIITKKKFTGIEASSYFGSTREGALGYNLGVTGGDSSEKGGFLLSFQYFKQSSLLSSKRRFSRADHEYDFETGEVTTSGSSAVPETYLGTGGVAEGSGNAAWRRLVGSAPDARSFTNDPTDGWRAFSATGNRDSGDGDFYNYQPENYLVTPSQRFSLWTSGGYELSRYAKAYFEGSYTSRRSSQLLAPEPLFTGTEGVVLSANNVYNPFATDFFDVRRRMVEAGNRAYSQDIDTYRAVAGVEGNFGEHSGFLSTWGWDLSFIYGRSEGTSVNSGRLVRSRLAAALGPSFIDDSGSAVCGTPEAPIADCTPLNLFGGAGTITQDMLKRLSYTGTARGLSEQRMASLSAEGELLRLWNRPVGLAFGYQVRREEGSYQPDPLTAAGDTTGNKEEPTAGGYTENAVFGELSVPVLADLPAVKVLEATAAVRAFNFSSFGSDATYKVGGRWQILDLVALRGTYSTAFRAPSVGELYSGSADSFQDANDPCANGPEGEIKARCEAAGVPANLLEDRSQLNAVVGGNKRLRPETAKILTTGVVITPKGNPYIDGLSLTVDYFRIKVANAISSNGASVTLSNCYTYGSASDCALIRRDATGHIDKIDDSLRNIGGSETSGVDLGLLYNLPIPVGRMQLMLNGVWLEKYNDILSQRTVKGKGVYDLEGVFPAIRFNTGLSWNWKDLGLGTTVRYIGPSRECENNDCSVENAKFRKVDSNVTADVYGSYAFSNPAGITSIMTGINNVFSADPAKIYQGFLADSNAATYDYLGRYFYVGLRHQL